MAIVNRIELSEKMPKLLSENPPSLFLFFGERYLCRMAVDELLGYLLQRQQATICTIDGDQEDAGQTLAKLMSFSLLPGKQIYRINDTRLFHSKNIGSTIWEKAHQAFKANRLPLATKYLSDLYSLTATPPQEWQAPADLTANQWQVLFGMDKPADLGWTTAVFTNNNLPGLNAAAGLADKYMEAFDRGIPPNNILILSAETVDKRKRLFSYIKNKGLIVDCSVAEGSGAAAQKVQKSILQEMMAKTLAEFNKTMDPKALELFFERVGFHPVAVVMETEKLALYCDDRATITLADLDRMVGRSREDALFELTDHFGKNELGKTLTTLHHLLENGVHGLAILATMRNFLRRLLMFRALQLQPTPPYHRGMSAKQFQDSYLPAIRDLEGYKDLLKGHPYALYMSFTKAAEYSCTTLKVWMELILQAEFELKGSSIPQKTILEHLLVTLLRRTPPSIPS